MKVFILLLISGLIERSQSESCNVPLSALNVAVHKKACQSSTVDTTPRPNAEYAVDGIAETNHTRYPCSMTNLEIGPWLTVDLTESFPIGFVKVVNRQDSGWQYLEGAEIRIGDSADGNNPKCATITGVTQAKPARYFFCRGMQGQYITVTHSGKPGILSICEIFAYQHVPEEGELGGW